MTYYYLKRFLQILYQNKIWFIVPVAIIILKILIVAGITPNKVQIASRVSINLEQPSQDTQSQYDQSVVNRAVIMLLDQGNGFLKESIHRMPSSLADSLIQLKVKNNNRLLLSKNESFRKVRDVIANRITIRFEKSNEILLSLVNFPKEEGIKLIEFLSKEMENYLRDKAVQHSFILDSRVSDAMRNLERQAKNLKIPQLSLQRKEFYLQQLERSQIIVDQLQDEVGLYKNFITNLKPLPTTIQVNESLPYDQVITYYDLLFFIILVIITMIIVTSIEFSGQNFVTESQMARYLKVELVGSIPRIQDPPKPGET